MKNNWWLYALLIITAISGVVWTAVGFVQGVAYLQWIGIIGLVVAAFAAVTIVPQSEFTSKCNQLFDAGKYSEARDYIEKAMKNPLYFLVRITVKEYYISACMALDDLETASRYVESLRHGGGAGWKYKTAYSHILIKLDAGDIETARTEYEEFRTQCAHAEIYREQIAILKAIFQRLLTVRNTEPLPAAAVESPYPVISRILGKHYEAQFAESDFEL